MSKSNLVITFDRNEVEAAAKSVAMGTLSLPQKREVVGVKEDMNSVIITVRFTEGDLLDKMQEIAREQLAKTSPHRNLTLAEDGSIESVRIEFEYKGAAK